MKRFDKQFTFWLNMNNESEYSIAEAIDWLKERRLFSSTIRDGIKLVCTLRDGSIDALLDMFPWVSEAVESRNPGANGGNGDNGQDDEIKALRETIASQQKTIDHLTTLIENPMVNKPADKKPSKQLPAPDAYTEPQIIITKAKTDDDNRSDWNFAISSAATVYGSFDGLPPKILEYGLRTGRIQPQQVDAKPALKKPVKPAKSKGQPVVLDVKQSPEPERTPGGLRKMQVPDVAFAAPEIDVESIQW